MKNEADGVQLISREDEEDDDDDEDNEFQVLETNGVWSPSFASLLRNCLLSSSVKQHVLTNVLGHSVSYHVSLSTETLTFGRQCCGGVGCLASLSPLLVHLFCNKIGTFQIQVVVTLAPNGWLWSWANPSFSSALTVLARQLRCDHALVPEFQADALKPCSFERGHEIGLVAAALVQAVGGYFIAGSSVQSTFFLLVEDCDDVWPRGATLEPLFFVRDKNSTPALIHFILEVQQRHGLALSFQPHVEQFLTIPAVGGVRLETVPSLPGDDDNNRPVAAFRLPNRDMLLVRVHPDGTLKGLSALIF